MASTIRKYSSRAQQTTLSSTITAVATTMTVTSASNLMASVTPSGGETYTVVIDPDTAVEEIVDVTGVAGSVLTIVRGVDNAGAGVAHSAGAIVRHMVIGRDLNEANAHSVGTLAQHAATTSLELKTLISDETGSGSLVFATSPTLVTPVLGVATATSINGTTIPTSATLIKASDTGTVTSTMILDGTILNADINASAAIDKTKISGTAVTVADTGTVTSTMILDGTILDADVNASAALAYSKLALTGAIVNTDITNDTITNAKINTAAAIDKTKISGTAVTVADTGTVTSTMILDGTILNADINASAAIALSKLATDPLARANHTGTQLAATVSDFDTQVRTSRLDQMAVPTATVSVNSQKITNLDTPTASADAANKGYVDTQITNLIAAAPGALDTLDELAAALGDDASFATTVTNSLAAKLPLAGGTMSGAIAMGTSKITGLGTPTVSTDAATKAYADTMLPLAGGTMSGAIAMGTSKITGVGDPTNAQDVVTKYYLDNVVLAPSNLTGPITSVANATSIASQTGTGTKFVVDTSPTLVTPVLGVATATSINGTTIPSTKTLVVTTDSLAVHAATTSAQLAGIISDETGSGSLVFATSPTLVTPDLGTPSAINLTNATAVPSDATKAPLASPTFTGTVTIPSGAVITDPKIGCTYSAKTAAYTFVSGDEGNLFSMNNAASAQFNIPTDATFNFAIGTEFNVFWITGAGQPTIGATTPGTTTVISTGATSATPKLRVANSGATCKKIAANSWIIFGDLA